MKFKKIEINKNVKEKQQEKFKQNISNLLKNDEDVF